MNSLFEAIKTATIAGILQWEPTGEVREAGGEYEVRGYTAQYKDLKLTTIVKQNRGQGYGLRIERGQESLTLTTNPKKLSGKKVDDVYIVAFFVDKESRKRDLDGELERQLMQAFLAKPTQR